MSKPEHSHRNYPSSPVNASQNTNFLPLLTKLLLKNKRTMFYFPMDSREITIDGLIDKCHFCSGLAQNYIDSTANNFISWTAPDFQILVTNGHLKTASTTVDLEFYPGDSLLKGRFIILTNFPSPL